MNSSKYDKVIKRFYEKTEKKRNEILQEHTFKKTNDKKSKKNFETRRNKNYENNKLMLNRKSVDNLNIKKNVKKNNIKKKKDYNQRDQSGKKEWEKHSNDIINHMKDVKFKKIFGLLDKDKKNYISYSNINFSGIPDNMLKALTPVTEEINRNKYKKISFQEFKKLTDETLSSCMMKTDED